MRELTVFNTMTREKSVFQPVKEGEVSIYVCGVTPYNHPHIGNARPFDLGHHSSLFEPCRL